MRSAPGISDVGAVVRELVTVDDAAPVVVVVAPGGASTLVGDAIARELSEAETSVERVVGQRAGPTHPEVDTGSDVIIATEAQWLDGAALDELRAHDGSLVIVHRRIPIAGALATVHAEAYEQGALVQLGPSTVDELVERGWDTDEAERAVTATAGRCDLLLSWEHEGSLGADVTIRLSMLDDTARRGAELRAFGATDGDLAALLDLSPERHDEVLQAIESEGLVDDGSMPPGIADAIRTVTTPGRRARVVELLVERPAPGGTVALADALAAVGDDSATAGSLYVEAAAELLGVDEQRGDELLALARNCGVDEVLIAPVAAELALVRGDPAETLRHLGDAGDDPDARLLAAAAWYALGDADATADALAESTLPELAPWAALAVGRAPTGGEPEPHPDPTAVAIAEAVDAWWLGERDQAIELTARAIVRSATSPNRSWPATAHEIAGVLASRLGDLARAAEIADAAVAERAGGPLHRRRELLMVAWCAARQGRLDDAAAAIGELGDAPLSPREEWLRAAVTCALALRDPEPDDLEAAASTASAALGRRTTEFYDLELLGEIAATLARVGASPVDELLRGQDALLDRLGRPAHLEFELAWVALLAAMSVDDDDALHAAARRVVDHPAPPTHHEQIVRVGNVLLACAEGDVDADTVVEVAERLAAADRPHEAARLCGIAAVHAREEPATRRLLKQSREWRTRRARVKQVRGVDRTVTRLTEQEERVARLVDGGLTYKAIGAELFISPKTVEHHVAHIRSKLGAGSRAELLSAIRGYLGSEAATSPS